MPQTTAKPTAAEKRRLERVQLYSPVTAHIAGDRATLIDLSPIGARLENATPLPIGGMIDLILRHAEHEIPIAARVVRCRLDRSITRDAIVYDTGLDFSDADPSLTAQVRKLLRTVAKTDLDARRKYTRTRKS